MRQIGHLTATPTPTPLFTSIPIEDIGKLSFFSVLAVDRSLLPSKKKQLR